MFSCALEEDKFYAFSCTALVLSYEIDKTRPIQKYGDLKCCIFNSVGYIFSPKYQTEC